MNLPAKIEYAFKAVLELTVRYGSDSPVQLNTISESQGIPKKFLTQLLLRLKNANIVNSSRGIAGGYNLTRPPSQISLADVFRAIDEDMLEIPKKTKSIKAADADKLILRIWGEISRQTVKQLERITFDRLAADLKSEQLTYYI